MPDDPAFIRMIAAAPGDDAPRLVYADVLEERGDPVSVARAEFIRVQCEKARLVPDTPRSRELWFREAALLDWAREWRRGLPGMKGVQYGGFIRGFIDRVEVRAPETYRTDPVAVGEWPRFGPDPRVIIERSPFTDRAAEVFDAVPVRTLHLVNLTGDGPEKLVELDGFCQTVELHILGVAVSPKLFEALVARGPWPSLRRLRVSPPSPGWGPEDDPHADLLARLYGIFRGQLE